MSFEHEFNQMLQRNRETQKVIATLNLTTKEADEFEQAINNFIKTAKNARELYWLIEELRAKIERCQDDQTNEGQP